MTSRDTFRHRLPYDNLPFFPALVVFCSRASERDQGNPSSLVLCLLFPPPANPGAPSSRLALSMSTAGPTRRAKATKAGGGAKAGAAAWAGPAVAAKAPPALPLWRRLLLQNQQWKPVRFSPVCPVPVFFFFSPLGPPDVSTVVPTPAISCCCPIGWGLLPLLLLVCLGWVVTIFFVFVFLADARAPLASRSSVCAFVVPPRCNESSPHRAG